MKTGLQYKLLWPILKVPFQCWTASGQTLWLSNQYHGLARDATPKSGFLFFSDIVLHLGEQYHCSVLAFYMSAFVKTPFFADNRIRCH